MSVSSNLQTQPSWLDTFPTESPACGFDEGGMWFSGDAGGAPYPIRTNYNIGSEVGVEVIYTFVYNDVDSGCPDHGICFFNADTEPYWSWGDDTTRIAVQYDCGTPEIEGQNNNSTSSEYHLVIGNTYTARVSYQPWASQIAHQLYDGPNVNGTLLDTIVLNNERLTGDYRIGFDADMDAGLPDKAYFNYLEISEGPVEIVTHVFRAMHFPHRRREVVSAEDSTPTNVQPGEMLYDEDSNKLYAGLEDNSVVQVIGSGGNSPYESGSAPNAIQPANGNNYASGYYSAVGGGYQNSASGNYSFVGGGGWLDPNGGNTASGTYSAVVGGWENAASGDASFIGGGGGNTASGNYSAVSGGRYNTASGYSSTIGGGRGNNASGNYSAVVGGKSNIASGTYSTVSGGEYNNASGQYSTVGGGYSNTANGQRSSVLGGCFNNIAGYTNAHIIGSYITATADNTTFVNNLQVDDSLRFKGYNDNTDPMYIRKDNSVSNLSVLQIVIGDDPTGNSLTYPTNGNAAVDYVAIMTTGGATHHLFGSDGKYYNAGGITFSDGSTQSSAGVTSNTSGITGATAITNIVKISQAGYDALVTKDPNTIYIIVG